MLSKKPIKEEQAKELTTHKVDISDLESSNILALRSYYRRNEYKYIHIYKYLVNLERISKRLDKPSKQLFLRDLSVEILQEIARYIPNKQIAMSFIISMVHINKKESIEKENKQELEDGTISELKKQSKTKEIENIKKLGLKVAIKGNKIIEKIYNNEIKKLLFLNHKYLNNTYDWGNKYFLSWYIKILNNFIYAREFLGKTILIMLYKEKCDSYKNIFIERLFDNIKQSNFYKSNKIILQDSLADFEKYLSKFGRCHIILNDECLSAYLSYEGRKDAQLQEKLSKKILKFKTKFTFVVGKTLEHKTDEFKKWGEGFVSYQNELKKFDEVKGNKFKKLINTFSSVVVKDSEKYKELFEIYTTKNSTTKLIKAIFFRDVVIPMEHSKKDMEELNNSKKNLKEYISKIYQYLNNSNLLSANNFYKILSSFMVLACNSNKFYNMELVCHAKASPRIISNYAKVLERYIKSLMINNLLKNNLTEILKRIELLVIYYENNLTISKQEELNFSYDYYDKCCPCHYLKDINDLYGMSKFDNRLKKYIYIINFIKNISGNKQNYVNGIRKLFIAFVQKNVEHHLVSLFELLKSYSINTPDIIYEKLKLFYDYTFVGKKNNFIVERIAKIVDYLRIQEVNKVVKQYIESTINCKDQEVSSINKLKIFSYVEMIFNVVKRINNEEIEDLFLKFAKANEVKTVKTFAKLIENLNGKQLLSQSILKNILCQLINNNKFNKNEFLKYIDNYCTNTPNITSKKLELFCDYMSAAKKIGFIAEEIGKIYGCVQVKVVYEAIKHHIEFAINGKDQKLSGIDRLKTFNYIDMIFNVIKCINTSLVGVDGKIINDLFFKFVKNSNKQIVQTFAKLIENLNGKQLLSQSILKNILCQLINNNKFNKNEFLKYIDNYCTNTPNITSKKLELFCDYMSAAKKIGFIAEEIGKIYGCERVKAVYEAIKHHIEFAINGKDQKLSGIDRLKTFNYVDMIFNVIKCINTALVGIDGEMIKYLFFKFIEDNNKQVVQTFVKLIENLNGEKLLTQSILKNILCRPMMSDNSKFNKANLLKYMLSLISIDKKNSLSSIEETFKLLGGYTFEFYKHICYPNPAYHLSKFENGFKAYMELVDIKCIDFKKEAQTYFFYFTFIQNNNEACIKNFVNLIKFLKNNNLLSRSILQDILGKPMVDSKYESDNANFIKYIYNYCIIRIKGVNKNEDIEAIKKIFKMLNGYISNFYSLIHNTQEHLNKFGDGFKAYIELIDVKDIKFKQEIQNLFFKFIQENSETCVKTFTVLVQLLNKNDLLSKSSFLKKILYNPNVNNNYEFSKDDCIKYIYTYCFEKINKDKKPGELKKILPLLCGNVLEFKKIDLIKEKMNNSHIEISLFVKINEIFNRYIKFLVENKDKQKDLKHKVIFSYYINAIYQIINHPMKIDQKFITQLLEILSDNFKEVNEAVFSLKEKNILVKKNINFITQYRENAAVIAIIFTALSKFNLLNKKSKNILQKFCEKDISFDLAMIFARMLNDNCDKYEEDNKSIMQMLFEHVFENFDTCNKYAKEIGDTIFYLRDANLFKIKHIKLWLSNKSYYNSFWMIRNLTDNDILDKNYKEALLLAKSNEATEVTGYLCDTKILYESTFNKLVELSKLNKLKPFCKIIMALYKFNKIKETIMEVEEGGRGGYGNARLQAILLTEKNYSKLDQFINVSDEICEIFEILSGYKIFNQLMLDYLYGKNVQGIKVILKQLQNPHQKENLGEIAKKFGELDKILSVVDFDRVLLWTNHETEKFMRIVEGVRCLLAMKSLSKETFEKVVELDGIGKLQQFYKIIDALSKYAKPKDKKIKTANNCFKLSKFVNVSNEICEIFKIFNEYKILNQPMLNYIYGKNDQGIKLILEQLQNPHQKKNLGEIAKKFGELDKILGVVDFDRVLLWTTGKFMRIVEGVRCLLAMKSLSKETFEKVVELDGIGKLQQFYKIIDALSKYAKPKDKKIKTANNCFKLSKFVNVSNEICEIFKIFNKYKILNQPMLDYIYGKNDQGIKLILEQLKNPHQKKNLGEIAKKLGELDKILGVVDFDRVLLWTTGKFMRIVEGVRRLLAMKFLSKETFEKVVELDGIGKLQQFYKIIDALSKYAKPKDKKIKTANNCFKLSKFVNVSNEICGILKIFNKYKILNQPMLNYIYNTADDNLQLIYKKFKDVILKEDVILIKLDVLNEEINKLKGEKAYVDTKKGIDFISSSIIAYYSNLMKEINKQKNKIKQKKYRTHEEIKKAEKRIKKKTKKTIKSLSKFNSNCDKIKTLIKSVSSYLGMLKKNMSASKNQQEIRNVTTKQGIKIKQSEDKKGKFEYIDYEFVIKGLNKLNSLIEKSEAKKFLDHKESLLNKKEEQAKKVLEKIQRKIINIIKPITAKNPEKRKNESTLILEDSEIRKNPEQKKKTNIIEPIKKAKIRRKFIFFRELGKLLYRLFCCCFCCFCCRKRKNRDGGNKLGEGIKNSYAKIVGKQTGGNKIPNTPKKNGVVIVIEYPDKDKKKEIIKKNRWEKDIVKEVTQTKIINPDEKTPLLPQRYSINNN